MSTAANDNPQAGQGRPLPKKEQDLFKSVVKHYESKQYKKGIKAADNILKKFPNHGETLCMKGLTLQCMGKKDEAVTLVKKGLMNDMRSHVCWHVYGLLHRADREYNEAIKAYKQALRIDSENLQILRDLSLLQVQMRDLSGFLVTRHTILTLKSNQRMNWLTYAVAKHLNGDLAGAVSVIDIYLGTMPEDSDEHKRGYESGELALYKNRALAEIPDNLQTALDHLEECKTVVMDQTAWLMTKGTYQLQLGRYDDASKTFLSLLERGLTEDYRVHSGYMCAVLGADNETCQAAMKLKGTATLATMKPLAADQRQALLKTYRGEFAERFPKSPAIRRIPLTLLEGDELKAAIDDHCRRGLTRGVPSLGSDLAALFLIERDGKYVTAADAVDIKAHSTLAAIVDLAEGYITSLLSESKFPGDDNKCESPSTILWAWYLRAYMHELCGEYPAALDIVDKCIEHTPTAVDMYELKGRILMASGDAEAAADCLDSGRDLDKQDRYINNQTTKYMLQAGRQSVAGERIALFVKHEGNPEQMLSDMQCSWYELELADCLRRQKEWGKSLKKYSSVVKHFEDWHEDQFDFHSYCIRKVTLRAYIDVLQFEDDLWGLENYARAAEGISRLYLHLYDNPDLTKEDEEPDYASMTAAQRKKAKAIARKKKKAAEKKAEEEKAAAVEAQKAAQKKGIKAPVMDEDPNGETLLKKDPLEEAKKFSAILSRSAPRRISTWLLQYDVAMRRKKPLLAMQALFKGRAIDAQSGELFVRIADFAENAAPEADSHEAAKEVLNSELPRLLNGKDVCSFVQDAAASAKSDPLTDLSLRVAIASAMVKTKAGSSSDAASLIVDQGLDGRGVSVKTVKAALDCLTEFGDEASAAKTKWIEAVKARFPLIKDFD